MPCTLRSKNETVCPIVQVDQPGYVEELDELPTNTDKMPNITRIFPDISHGNLLVRTERYPLEASPILRMVKHKTTARTVRMDDC